MARLRIEVVYASRESQQVVLVELDEGANAMDAFTESRLGGLHPEIDAAKPSIGIFGRKVVPETLLTNGDRVEIYRALQVDPKSARRAKASAKKRPAR